MKSWQQRVANEFIIIRKNSRELVTPTVKLDAHKVDIRHTVHQRTQGSITALFDNLHRFGTFVSHAQRSTVKAPVAVATGFSLSSSVAVARTKETERVMW